MKRDVGVYLEDILESIKRIEEYTQKITEEDFYKNVPIQDAVVRRFEIIGELEDYQRGLDSISRGNKSNTSRD